MSIFNIFKYPERREYCFCDLKRRLNSRMFVWTLWLLFIEFSWSHTHSRIRASQWSNNGERQHISQKPFMVHWHKFFIHYNVHYTLSIGSISYTFQQIHTFRETIKRNTIILKFPMRKNLQSSILINILLYVLHHW